MELKSLKGIGVKTQDLFSRLDIYSVEDLLNFYPRDYDVYEKPALISECELDSPRPVYAIFGMIASSPSFFNKGKLSIITITVRDQVGNGIKLSWYNMPYLRSKLKMGSKFIFRGRVVRKGSSLNMEQASIFTPAEYQEKMGCMQPIYRLTHGLSNNAVIKAMKQALEIKETNLEKEYLPDWIRQSLQLAEHNFAISNIHFPRNKDDYIKARERLSFEEFFIFVLSMRLMKLTNERRPNKLVVKPDKRTDEFLKKLPFKLTKAQLSAWQEVRSNMYGPNLMSRLVQGDVGSGKTMIAVLALMDTVLNGYQGAIMVPTEVLAKQHYQSFTKYWEMAAIDTKIQLLVGSMTAKQKREAYADIESGETKLIIGTHALIQEAVKYKNLALVITDEQHRFGVNQRKSLSEKGEDPHILVMSATPIPRTLAIIVYGDLDISIIDELPAERLPIKNAIIDPSMRPNSYRFIEKQVRSGHQAYVICPMVEENEEIKACDVITYSKELKEKMPSDIRIEYLHGKMKASEKNDIMERFAQGQIDVLVSTTVIEVGVNVPNASVMMIENANRFGLAQLHQLRGRVGRGNAQSFCIFVSDVSKGQKRERLDILTKTNDGFKIAEEDLKLRGPGDFFGIRQSGDLDFGLADIYTDAGMLKKASDMAGLLLEKDPLLEGEENSYLKDKVDKYTLDALKNINL